MNPTQSNTPRAAGEAAITVTGWSCHRRPGQPDSQTSVWEHCSDGSTMLLFSAGNTACVEAVKARNSHAALVAALEVSHAALVLSGLADRHPLTMQTIRDAIDQVKATP